MGKSRPGIIGRDLFPELCRTGTAIVSDNFAMIHKVQVGDTVTVNGKHGPLEFRIAGTVQDYTWNRGSLYLDRALYVREFDDTLVDSFDIYLKPGADAEAVRKDIARRWGAQEALVVLTRAELRQTIADVVHRLYALAYAQQIVVALVAGLGVVTALLISVLQRRRELGLLRAVGASQLQILFTVLAEAVLMGLVGAVIGLLVGVPLEWYAVRVILLEETGFSFAVRVPWRAAGVVTLLALATAILAGLGPAVHAMRQRIAEAIAYE
jgi:putative ABC transport system permease protein